MNTCHVKKGDEVVVLSGPDRGKRGKIIEVLPAKQRVIIEGIKLIKRHIRKNQANPQGTISSREGTLHASNVMLATTFDARAAKRNATKS